MILVDFSGLAISAITADFDMTTISSLPLCRHKVLDSIRYNNRNYRETYGEMVICIDAAGGYWRKDIFPYYKAKRSELKEESDIDWDQVYQNIDTILSEIKENLPYRVVGAPRIEADDVIGYLALNCPGKHIVISKDKDMAQLLLRDNVDVYDPRVKAMVSRENVEMNFFKHVVKGDTIDGITNILSDDDTLITQGKRQKPVTQKKLDEWFSNREAFMKDHGEKYLRNLSLISLFDLPEKINSDIAKAFENSTVNGRNKIFKYFANAGLEKHMNRIEDF